MGFWLFESSHQPWDFYGQVSAIFEEEFEHTEIELSREIIAVKITAGTMQSSTNLVPSCIDVRVGTLFQQVLHHNIIISSHEQHQ